MCVYYSTVYLLFFKKKGVCLLLKKNNRKTNHNIFLNGCLWERDRIGWRRQDLFEHIMFFRCDFRIM